MNLRPDLEIISQWIPQESRVLDLGCGDGTLLKALREQQVSGYGIEIDNGQIAHCIDCDINVIQADLDQGLPQFSDQSFDFVIVSQTLQTLKRPDHLLEEIVRVGKQAIIGFPNFGHWQCRLHLLLRGTMPISKTLPDSWFKTSNTHLFSIKDFEHLCRQEGISISKRSIVNHQLQDTFLIGYAPNFFGQIALYQINKSSL